MEITKVEIQKNNADRVNVYIDDKFYCGLYLDTCLKYGIEKGVQIEKDTIDEYILDSEKHTAFNKTMNYLKSALKTRKQVREYLNKKEYNKITIDYVLDKLTEYGYVSDEQYALSYIETYKNKYGPLRLKANLIQKGVDKELVDKCLETNLNSDDELDSGLEKVASKYLKNKEITPENIAKLVRFLSYRGYEFDSINAYISKLRRGE